jgi:large subunit ribosomal protein L10
MRPEKKAIVEEVRRKLEAASYVFLVDYRGLTVEQFAQLRSRLHDTGATVQVIKNSLFGRAATDMGTEDVLSLLDGPLAMVVGDGDVTETAKALKRFVDENELPLLKGGMLGDRLLSSDDLKQMAAIPPREVMLARAVGTLAAPMSQLVGVLNQKLLTLLYVLKAIQDKKGGA